MLRTLLGASKIATGLFVIKYKLPAWKWLVCLVTFL